MTIQVQSAAPKANIGFTRGIVLLAIGAIFLLKNFGAEIPLPENSWAGILLVIGVAYLWTAWRHYSTDRDGVRKYFRTGLTLTILGVIFLLNLDMGKLWPVFLIAAGISAMFFPRRSRLISNG